MCGKERGAKAVGSGEGRARRGQYWERRRWEAISWHLLLIIPPWTPSLPISRTGVLAVMVTVILKVGAPPVLLVQRSTVNSPSCSREPRSHNISGPQALARSRKTWPVFANQDTDLSRPAVDEGLAGDGGPDGGRVLIAHTGCVLTGPVRREVVEVGVPPATALFSGPQAGLGLAGGGRRRALGTRCRLGHGSASCPAWISCATSSQFLSIGKGEEPWLVTEVQDQSARKCDSWWLLLLACRRLPSHPVLLWPVLCQVCSEWESSLVSPPPLGTPIHQIRAPPYNLV